MKSLVLKDLFNIGHNAKSMLFILVVFAVALIPFSGVEGYIFVCAILCSMMIVMILSRLVDTFISRISLTMLPVPNPHNTVCVLSWEEARRWQSRSSGYSSS